MANFLPDAFREELERLQDQVPPRPYRDIEARAARGVRRPRARPSCSPSSRPSRSRRRRSARSTARGCTTGEEVAVKVQYPDIEEIVRIDLRALRRIFGVAALVHARLRLRHHLPRDPRDGAGRARLPARGGGDREDRRPTSRAPQRAQATSASRASIAEFSTARVLTTEWIEGTKVADLERLEQPEASIAGRRRASASRPTASRSSPTASITPIRTPGTCWSQTPAAPGAAPDDRVPRLRRDRPPCQRGDAARDDVVPAGRDDARHDAHRVGDEGDGLHLAARRSRGLRPGRPVLPRQDARRRCRSRASRSRTSSSIPRRASAACSTCAICNVSLADLRDAFHIPKEWILLERTLLLLLGVCTTLDPR